jgi:hypothetical protein
MCHFENMTLQNTKRLCGCHTRQNHDDRMSEPDDGNVMAQVVGNQEEHINYDTNILNF